ncbi:NADPH:quinone oxidoreductase family protein [Calidifontibacter sp. DB0510]|uniref:NADPH:quinone oxidoreductase family protein n=1 Tax=Metallococcus carri TaxID=1656884 RepID=A0A967AZB2_9MICO|nr:NADPH:quinone oxidoreductase family protein [Metallococcus carri]NHN55448.1 NADPH:quinone oxidoreductase family protein [Metallococcus carri]NOP38368.1 NADPH:quinone oxidoreductase family protein [Calidifontibacter sp. DB2511S]
MRAIHFVSTEGPSVAQVVDLPEPDATDKVIVDVQVAGVSFPDLLQSKGEYQIQPPTPYVPGAEVSGVVRSAPGGSGFAAGDRVAAFPGFGGFAETVAVDPAMVFPLPDAVSFEAAAALPMNYLTCLFALLHRGGLRSGETVLVHGAAGGIGTAALQIARAAGARTIAVVSSDDKEAVARAAGADEVVRADGFKDAVKELTDGRGVDVVLDPVGGDRFTDSLRSLATLGRLLVIGFTGGEIPTVKVNRLLLNNISVVGVGWGAYWMPRPAEVRKQWDELVALFGGRFDPPIGARFPLDQLGEALTALAERRVTGKVLLTVR